MEITVQKVGLGEFLQCLAKLPDFYELPTIEEIRKRVGDAEILSLVAVHDNELVGCKLGYSLDGDSFYSWLGGVLPDFRRLGVARQLMRFQEDWVNANGYTHLRVKSMNHYPNMLRFLISEGYQIVDLEPGSPEKLKVHFQKQIKP